MAFLFMLQALEIALLLFSPTSLSLGERDELIRRIKISQNPWNEGCYGSYERNADRDCGIRVVKKSLDDLAGYSGRTGGNQCTGYHGTADRRRVEQSQQSQ